MRGLLDWNGLLLDNTGCRGDKRVVAAFLTGVLLLSKADFPLQDATSGQ